MRRVRVKVATILLLLLFFFFFFGAATILLQVPFVKCFNETWKHPIPFYIFSLYHIITHLTFLSSSKLGFGPPKWPTFQWLKCARQTWLSQKPLASWTSAQASRTSCESGTKLFRAASVLLKYMLFLLLVFQMHACSCFYVIFSNSYSNV